MSPRSLYQSILAALPPTYRYVFRKTSRFIYYLPIELLESMRGERKLPPRHLRLVGDGDFIATGNSLLEHMVEVGAVESGYSVLDIGAGIGRLALPLTDYLGEQGRYTGFEIMKSCVDWCKGNISAINPNFEFHHADIYNANYNADGKLKAESYKFPSEDDSIDFAFATSVFTHMGWAETRSYLAEISRVLKPGAKAYLTFFLLNSDCEVATRTGRSRWQFPYEAMGGSARELKNPEAAIAFDENKVLEALRTCNLEVSRVIYGSWAGGDPSTLQDVLLVQKSH